MSNPPSPELLTDLADELHHLAESYGVSLTDAVLDDLAHHVAGVLWPKEEGW